MPSQQSWCLLTVASLGTLLCIPALGHADGLAYGGMGFEHAKFDLHADRMAGLLSPGLDADDAPRREGSTGYKLFTGHQTRLRFGLGAGYYRLGEPAAKRSPPPAVQDVQPAPAVLKRVSISAASLFDFDKATLRPEGKVMLDNFCVDIWELRYDRIEVTGHTDRLGSAAHNKKLSQQRADAAKRYLIQTGRVDAGKLVAIGTVGMVGMDQRTPVTDPGECKGSAPTQTLKECLRLDRRVDVLVTGQR